MRTFRVLCPRCGRRIFDAYEGVKGAVVSVRCPRCKTISILDLLACVATSGVNQNKTPESQSRPTEPI